MSIEEGACMYAYLPTYTSTCLAGLCSRQDQSLTRLLPVRMAFCGNH